MADHRSPDFLSGNFLSGIVGSFSTGADGNPTVAMMDAAFADEGLDMRYVNCEVPESALAAAVAGAIAMGWLGFNCSMPHKQRVIPMLDSLSETARIAQAVNCVTRSDEGLVGHNTDGAGFLKSVAPIVDPAGIDALVIGSGGAAWAIAVELGLAGAASITIASRNTDTASALVRLVEANTSSQASVLAWPGPMPLRPPASARLIVNATPVGSVPDADAAIDLDWSAIGGAVVADVIVNPPTTTFLRRAADAGLETIDGTGMLVNQGAENVRLWTGTTPDTAPMRAALEAALGL